MSWNRNLWLTNNVLDDKVHFGSLPCLSALSHTRSHLLLRTSTWTRRGQVFIHFHFTSENGRCWQCLLTEKLRRGAGEQVEGYGKYSPFFPNPLRGWSCIHEWQEVNFFGIALGRTNLINPGRRTRLPGYTEMLSQRLCDNYFLL